MNFATIMYLLEQTAEEKRLTVLYVSLFVVAIGMLVLDSLAMKKWTPSGVKVLLFIILIVAFVAMILLISSSYGK